MLTYKSLSCQLNPNWVDWAYKSLTVCYHSDSYGDSVDRERKIEKIAEVVRKGHKSIARNIDLFFHIELAPHDSLMQIRTHKFLDCQITSQRYTGDHLLTGDPSELAEQYFYFRPEGYYPTRNGVETISRATYKAAKEYQASTIYYYRDMIADGCEPETARSVLAQGIRQSASIHCNLQALLDFIHVRSTRDVQWEVRQIVDGMIDSRPQELNIIVEPFCSKFYGKNTSTF